MADTYEVSVSTKLKACAALLLKGEAWGLNDAAEKLGWNGAALHAATSPWCAMEEGVDCWIRSTKEELATFLLFVAEANRPQGRGED